MRELTDRIENTNAARAEEVEVLKKSVSELDKSFGARIDNLSSQVDELKTRQGEFAKKFEGIDESINRVEKGLKDVDESTALKKSADFD